VLELVEEELALLDEVEGFLDTWWLFEMPIFSRKWLV
jgi:hypothetical protein